MAILDETGERVLLGRQKAWPKGELARTIAPRVSVLLRTRETNHRTYSFS